MDDNSIITPTFLNDSWVMYFHDPYDIEWDTNSYKMIGQMSTVEDFIYYFKSFNNLFKKGMFFIMRLDIMPQYEDELNINGGCFSFKIYPEDLEKRFFNLCTNVLGENIGKEDDYINNINGISISPKKFYYIARIWIKNNKYAKKDLYNFDIPKYSSLMYKNHI
tara:strand:- start:178 stop:669 length:492 start_codon:yes stop_codon:yes gene_type:complete